MKTNHKRGTEHYKAKLTPEDVILIRKLAEERVMHVNQARELSNKKIAEKFGVNASTIDKIVNIRAWAHIP